MRLLKLKPEISLFFLLKIKIKNLVTSIVQIALYERYVRRFGRPEYVVGTVNGDSPLGVCIGQTTFEDMILTSQVAKPIFTLPKVVASQGETLLSGISLAELGIFKFNEDSGKYQRVAEDKQEIVKILAYLFEECHVKKLVNIQEQKRKQLQEYYHCWRKKI